MTNKFTPREQDVFEIVISGCTNPEVAKYLGISVDAVKNNLKNIYRKTGTANRTELAATVGLNSNNNVFGNLQKSPKPLSGLWASKFTYTRSNGKCGAQFDIENIWSNKSGYSGENIFAYGEQEKYLHTLDFQVRGRMLCGRWNNTNSENEGVFQLRINSSRNSMVGMHLGNNDKLEIKYGDWYWVKIEAPSEMIMKLIKTRNSELFNEFKLAIETQFEKCLFNDVKIEVLLEQ